MQKEIFSIIGHKETSMREFLVQHLGLGLVKGIVIITKMIILMLRLFLLMTTCNAIVVNQYESVNVVAASWIAIKSVDNIQ